MKRIKYIKYQTYLDDNKQSLIVKKRGGGERIIPYGKWYLNTNTPVGEDADIWENVTYGRRQIDRNNILGILTNETNETNET
jgi:hypothetical protein